MYKCADSLSKRTGLVLHICSSCWAGKDTLTSVQKCLTQAVALAMKSKNVRKLHNVTEHAVLEESYTPVNRARSLKDQTPQARSHAVTKSS